MFILTYFMEEGKKVKECDTNWILKDSSRSVFVTQNLFS